MDLMEFKLWLQVTFNPTTWMRQAWRTNWEWDRAVRATLAAGHIPISKNNHTIDLNGVEIWWSNGYFAMGQPYSFQQDKFFSRVLPSRRTVLLLKKILREHTLGDAKEELTEVCNRLILGVDNPPVTLNYGAQAAVNTAVATRTGVASSWAILGTGGEMIASGSLPVNSPVCMSDEITFDPSSIRIV